MPVAPIRHAVILAYMTFIVDIPKALKEIADPKVARCRDALAHASPHPFEHSLISASLEPVFAYSDFVAKTCTLHPDYLIQLVDSETLFNALPQDGYHRTLSHGLKPISQLIDEGSISRVLPTLQQILRHIRHQAMVRIAWRDLAGWSNLDETMADLSQLAETCLMHATNVLHAMHCKVYGQPQSPQDQAQQLVVLGMGKLGALELNFSSDVDLIFTYAENGITIPFTFTGAVIAEIGSASQFNG